MYHLLVTDATACFFALVSLQFGLTSYYLGLISSRKPSPTLAAAELVRRIDKVLR